MIANGSATGWSGVLDVEDPIAGEYRLEVSSPGLDRLLFTRPSMNNLLEKP